MGMKALRTPLRRSQSVFSFGGIWNVHAAIEVFLNPHGATDRALVEIAFAYRATDLAAGGRVVLSAPDAVPVGTVSVGCWATDNFTHRCKQLALFQECQSQRSSSFVGQVSEDPCC